MAPHLALALQLQAQVLRAPQLGLWSGMPPPTDNPAARAAAPVPAFARELLARLRAAS